MNSYGSRFRCPSSSLMLKALLHRARGVLWGCSVLAIAVHIGSSTLGTFQVEEQVAKPLTTKFVKREPRLTKPLEMKKRPQPKRRRIQRKMISVKAEVHRQGVSNVIRPAEMVVSLAKPQGRLSRPADRATDDMDLQVVAAHVVGTKDAENAVDMHLEMLDIEALDTGQYQAMVIQDPDDKRNIRGFLHLGVAYYRTTAIRWDIVNQFIQRVVEAVNQYTDIQADVAEHCLFGSAEMLKIPWMFFNMEGRSFRLASADLGHLGRYLTRGGFLLVETGYPHGWDTPAEGNDGTDLPKRGELISTIDMFKGALGAVGRPYARDWVFEELPPYHPIYSCYFDFDQPPAPWRLKVKALEVIHGITIHGHLVGIIETGDYERFVANANGADGTRHKQFIVNTVIFALTQEGSITNRVMDSIR